MRLTLIPEKARRRDQKIVTSDRRDELVSPFPHLSALLRRSSLSFQRRAKRRAPMRDRIPLTAPHWADRTWSTDFMSDALYHGLRFRTFNVVEDSSRKVLAIDTLLRAARLIRVLELLL